MRLRNVKNAKEIVRNSPFVIQNPSEYKGKYKEEVSGIKNFHLLGRLAEYQYYNIDVMVEKAMELAEKLGE